jgi:hypothetical protein
MTLLVFIITNPPTVISENTHQMELLPLKSYLIELIKRKKTPEHHPLEDKLVIRFFLKKNGK